MGQCMKKSKEKTFCYLCFNRENKVIEYKDCKSGHGFITTTNKIGAKRKCGNLMFLPMSIKDMKLSYEEKANEVKKLKKKYEEAERDLDRLLSDCYNVLGIWEKMGWK